MDKIEKFNGGRGALLCNGCNIIIATGFGHEDKEHFCPTCMLENTFKEANERYKTNVSRGKA